MTRLVIRDFSLFPKTAKTVKTANKKTIASVLLMLALASCASQGTRETELAAQEREAAQLAQQQEREQAAELQRQREQQAAERARVQAEAEAERDRQVAEATARAEAERQQREAAEQRERERLAASAAVEAERQQKIDRIAALEQQIASIQTQVVDEESRRDDLDQAIVIAEELLAVLAAEQAKYEDTDAEGNTVEPLDKELITELESRKNELLRQANSQ